MRHFTVLGASAIAIAIAVVIAHHERSAPRDDDKLSATRDELIRAEQAMRDLPPTINDLTVDGVTYTGKREPAVESLASTLAAMGSPVRIQDAGPFITRHCLSFIWAPPSGSSFRRDFEIGDVDAGGCMAKQGGELVRLPRAICTDVAAVGVGFTPGVTTCASAELRALMRRERQATKPHAAASQ